MGRAKPHTRDTNVPMIQIPRLIRINPPIAPHTKRPASSHDTPDPLPLRNMTLPITPHTRLTRPTHSGGVFSDACGVSVGGVEKTGCHYVIVASVMRSVTW